MIVSITNQNFENEIINSSKPAIVDVYAEWCGPCKQMMPHFESLAIEMSGTHTFAKLDVDQARELALKHSISSVPTILFFKDGVVVGRETGYMGKETLKKKIDAIFKL